MVPGWFPTELIGAGAFAALAALTGSDGPTIIFAAVMGGVLACGYRHL
jgi:hypothetical protein